MEPILLLIAQFLAPWAQGLDVVPYALPAKTYEFSNPVGVFLLRLEKKQLVIELPFRAAPYRVAAEFLESIRLGLNQGIPLENGKWLKFKWNKHHYCGCDRLAKTDYHASTYDMVEVDNLASEDLPDPRKPLPAPTDTVAALNVADSTAIAKKDA